MEATKPTVATSLATDVVLLLIMLIGLFRERIRGGGAFALGRMLWNQVRWLWFSLVVIVNSLMSIFVCKGLIWLLVATAAEVPSTVRLPIILRPLSLLMAILYSQLFMFLSLNGLFFVPFNSSRWLLIELYSRKPPLAEPLTIVRPCLLRVGCDVIDFLCISTRQMLLLPSNIMVTAAATRMYRHLVEFGSEL